MEVGPSPEASGVRQLLPRFQVVEGYFGMELVDERPVPVVGVVAGIVCSGWRRGTCRCR